MNAREGTTHNAALAEAAGGVAHQATMAEIIGAFETVARELGYGFAETVYVRALAIELFRRRMNVAREQAVTVYYKGVTVGTYRADLVIEDRIVVEVVTGPTVTAEQRATLRNYLRSSGKTVGLLLHFGPSPTFTPYDLRPQGVRWVPWLCTDADERAPGFGAGTERWILTSEDGEDEHPADEVFRSEAEAQERAEEYNTWTNGAPAPIERSDR